MNQFDFMTAVQECFDGLKSEDEIEERAKQMKYIVERRKITSEKYLKSGIL